MELRGIFLLNLAVSAISAASSTCGELYQVKQGDTCFSISQSFKLSLENFLSINPRINCTNLAIDEQVCASSCLRNNTSSSQGPRPVLMDYIGAMNPRIRLEDVFVAEEVDHYFILSFAIDESRSGAVQNGSFIRYWSDSLTPESVLQLKTKHPNVKVLLSLAGYSLQVDGKDELVRWYDPLDVDLDGVDIDYESMNASDSRLFPFCIGEVVKYLKKNKAISVATVAPYGDSAPYYQRLLRYYGDHFDYVNFQFYSFSDVTNATGYVELYHKIAAGFDRGKLLVSLEVDGKAKARGVSGAQFFKAVEYLRESVEIPGIFLWSAEGSMENGFLVEKVAQCKLTAKIHVEATPDYAILVSLHWKYRKANKPGFVSRNSH